MPDRQDIIIKYVDAYRREYFLEERLKLATKIHRLIEGDLRLYIMARIYENEVDDVLAETLKAIFTSLMSFRGKTDAQFRAWCYRIASNKIYDQVRRRGSDPLLPLPMEELENLVTESAKKIPLSTGERLDLEYAMNQLAKAKPACRDLLLSHFIDDLSVKELAAQLNLKIDAIRRRIERCLDLAGGLLGEEYG